MWQVVQYNSGIYACALVIICAAWLFIPHTQPVVERMVVAGIATALLFWVCSSLLVSHYVYDCSPLYDLNWVKRYLSKVPSAGSMSMPVWTKQACGSRNYFPQQ